MKASITILLVPILLSGCTLLPAGSWGPSDCPPPDDELPVKLPQCPAAAVVERIITKIVPAELPPMATTAGKMHLPIVGAIEWVRIEPAGLLLESRIDTGAVTTSVHADNIQLVEKEGKRYVRFVLTDPNSDEKVEQELRLRRRVLIKQSGLADIRRYVVRMWVTLGETRSRIDVNLSDRTGFEYPLLIGRNFLTDSMIVDVSRHHTVLQ
tara:strand:- start:6508 stop:7137 length:630 start_codon:yes stop_codon:yes gene_type:complete